MPLPLLGLLGAGAAVGGIGAATNAISSVASKVPVIGPLIGCLAGGIGQISAQALPGLFSRR